MPLRLSRWALLVFLAFTAGRLALAPSYELMPQSAYYSLYAAYPDWSYFDHPPLLGWLLWVSTGLFGATAFGLRMGMILTAVATQWMLLRLARAVRPEIADQALVLYTSTGLVTIVSLIATPDGPLLFGWALALLLLHRAIFAAERGAGAWVMAGTAMGIAFLAKYTALFLPLGLFAFLVASPNHRRRLLSIGPWLAILAMQVVSLPVYVWNWTHDFASFRFQLGERTARLALQPDLLGGFIVSQLAMVLPMAFLLVLGGAAIVSWRRLRAGRDDRSQSADQDLFLLAFFLPLFLFCVGLSTVTWVKVNWPMPAYLTGVLLAAPWLTKARSGLQIAISVTLHLALAVELVLYPVPVESHDTWMGWSDIATEVERRATESPAPFVFAVDGYKTTAELLFYSDLETYGRNIIGCPALQLDYLGHDLDDLVGRNALFVRNEPRLKASDRTTEMVERVAVFFDDLEELPPIEVRHRGRLVRLVRLFEATRYRGPDAAFATDRQATMDPCRFVR